MADIESGRIVPPPPHQSPVISKTGLLTPVWSTWFRQLYVRIGQSAALTNVELAANQIDAIATINANITALQTTVTTQAAQIAELQTGLDQGPNL